MKYTVILALLLVLLVCTVESQRTRTRNRNRNRNRNRKGDQCHMKEIDTCLDKVQALSKGKDPTAIITTNEGIDKLCSTFDEVMKCFKGYMKKCGTPLQRELFEFGTEYFIQTTKQFCDPGPLRETFLKHSPCIHSKVLTSNDYKSTCNNNYLAAVDRVNQTDPDRTLDMVCCAHNTWEDCTEDLVSKECGPEPVTSMKAFVEKALGGINAMVCPRNIFPPDSQTCKKALPPPGTKAKGKRSDNPISKYISSYFGFLFSS